MIGKKLKHFCFKCLEEKIGIITEFIDGFIISTKVKYDVCGHENIALEDKNTLKHKLIKEQSVL